MKWWQWAGVALLVLIVIGALVGEPDENADSGSVQTPTVQEPEPEPEPVDLSVQTPGEKGVVFNERIVLRGEITRGATVLVDDEEANVQRGQWSKTIELDRGTQIIEIVATKGGASAEDSVEVTRKRSATERAELAARRERERQQREAEETARVAALTQKFSGDGSKNIGTIEVERESTLEWTNSDDATFRQMLIYDKAFGISVGSEAESGDTVVPAGTYEDVTVAGGNWTITIKPTE